MSVSGFAARGNAVEGSYFRKEQECALRKQLERLVQQGQLPQSALQQASALQLATDARPNNAFVYQHVKGAVPGVFQEPSVTIMYAACMLNYTVSTALPLKCYTVVLQCQNRKCHGPHLVPRSALDVPGNGTSEAMHRNSI